MLRRILLHIGGEKTGSTSIQALLALNRAALLQAGFAVPRSAGLPNAIGLAAFAAPPALGADLVAAFGGAAAVAALPTALAAEVAALPPHVHTLLLSGEHCQSRLHDTAAIARLRDGVLAPLGAAEIQVLVWLRRQDGIARSLRNTWLRSHGTLPEPPFPEDAPTLALLDHQALLARWGAVFGPAALRPRIFEHQAFASGELLGDFVAACGLAQEPALRLPRRLNRSLAAPAEAFLAALGPALDGRAADLRPLHAFLEQRFAGQGRRPARAAAAAFLARFAAGNEAVRRDFFPVRPWLFDPALDDYPEAADPPPAAEEVLAVAVAAAASLVATRPAR